MIVVGGERMFKITKQMKEWRGDFGKKYTDRNALSLNELDELYRKNYGITGIELNNLFIGELDRTVKVLEVGSNSCYFKEWDFKISMVLK